MKSFTNVNPRDLRHALTLVQQARQDGRSATLAGSSRTGPRELNEKVAAI